MKLEQNNKSLLFSETCIPDIFFTEYLNSASGDFVKVYLYVLFLSKHERAIELLDLSKRLNVTQNIAYNALKYWEEQGILVKSPTGYIVNNLRQIEIDKLYSPKLNSSPEELEKNAQNRYRTKAIENINRTFFQGVMSPTWYNDIDLWFKKYEFDEQVMISLFTYCFEKSALHRKYVQTVADAWNVNGIKTNADLDTYYNRQEKLLKIRKLISKKLGLNRNLSEYENAYIDKWIIDYKYSFEIIEIALKKTTGKSNPNFDYLDKIITDWKEKNLKTVSDIENFIKEFSKKQKDIKNMEKNNSRSAYDKLKYDKLKQGNLDNLYDNLKTAKQ